MTSCRVQVTYEISDSFDIEAEDHEDARRLVRRLIPRNARRVVVAPARTCDAAHPDAGWIPCQLVAGHTSEHMHHIDAMSRGERMEFEAVTIEWADNDGRR